MKKLFLPLLAIVSLYAVGNEQVNQSTQAFLERTDHYFTSGDYIKECPYDGYTWQEVKALVGCNNCEAPLITHAACTNCGFYKGVKVLETKMDRTIKRGKARQAQAARRKTAPQEESPEQQ